MRLNGGWTLPLMEKPHSTHIRTLPSRLEDSLHSLNLSIQQEMMPSQNFIEQVINNEEMSARIAKPNNAL